MDRVQVFPGMRHIDAAGGTGDVADRVRTKIDIACENAARHRDDAVRQVSHAVRL